MCVGCGGCSLEALFFGASEVGAPYTEKVPIKKWGFPAFASRTAPSEALLGDDFPMANACEVLFLAPVSFGIIKTTNSHAIDPQRGSADTKRTVWNMCQWSCGCFFVVVCWMWRVFLGGAFFWCVRGRGPMRRKGAHQKWGFPEFASRTAPSKALLGDDFPMANACEVLFLAPVSFGIIKTTPFGRPLVKPY